MKKRITVRPADRSKESIMNLVSISFEGKNIIFNGSLKERLAQYSEVFGKEWQGFPESRFTEIIHTKNFNVPLMGTVSSAASLPLSKELQNLREELTRKANELVVECKKEIASWEASRTTEVV